MENQASTTYARILVGALVLQQAVDELPSDQKVYFANVKNTSNKLARQLLPITARGYTKLNDEGQGGLATVWDTYDFAAGVLSKLGTAQFGPFRAVLDALLNADENQTAEALAILSAYFSGEVTILPDEGHSQAA